MLRKAILYSLSWVLLLSTKATAETEFIVEPVAFYPKKKIELRTSTLIGIQQLQQKLQQNPSINYVKNDGDYQLDIDYAIGCGERKHIYTCHIGIYWHLLRHDMAPVGLWIATYPLKNITPSLIQTRFKNISFPKIILEKATKEFNQILLSYQH